MTSSEVTDAGTAQSHVVVALKVTTVFRPLVKDVGLHAGRAAIVVTPSDAMNGRATAISVMTRAKKCRGSALGIQKL
jgi:hypothetical protein